MVFIDIDDDDDGGDTILDDGLSAGDEERPSHRPVTSAQAAALRADAYNYQCVSLFLLFLTFVVSLAVATVHAYRPPHARQQGAGGWDFDGWSNSVRRQENARRLARTLAYVTQYAVSDPAALVPQPGAAFGRATRNSPQYQAALWIAQVDTYRLPIPAAVAGDRTREEERQFTQRYSLAVFFFATGGVHFWLWQMEFLSGRHECEWNEKFRVERSQLDVHFGVFCDGAPDFARGEEDSWKGLRTVTGISLPPANRLLGTLPPEIRHLNYLKALHIEQNKGLVGAIPFQYGWLKHLGLMALMDNSLTGKIPREFGHLKNMRYLRLERNQLTADTIQGDLDFIGEMDSLNFLTLDYNPGITGTLSDVFHKLSNMEVFSLSDLGMYGTLPPSLSTLTQLKALYLDDNRFEGKIGVLQNLTTLTHVYLEDNLFDDAIDDAFLQNAKRLVHLDLSNCSFTGSVPGHLLQLSSLEVLDMSLNKLEGGLPTAALSDIVTTSLEFLSLHSNNITGTIPTSIGQLTSLSTLDLSLNRFSGDLPAEIGDLADLEILFLGKNTFDVGPVPEWLRHMTQLTELSLKSASLNATIPAWLGDLTRLHFLDLGENDLGGTIPQSLAKLAKLMVLILNGNRLEGELGLGPLEKLETLLIDDNDLTGDAEAMCAHTLVHFIADCAPGALAAPFACACCTLCCARENATCNDDAWLGNHEAIWEFGYGRRYWDFEDNGILSPYIDYNAHQG